MTAVVKEAVDRAIKILAEPSWGQIIWRPLSEDAAQLLADLMGGTKLTSAVMDKHRTAVTELVTKGCIKINLKGRDKKTGIIPGAMQPRKILALADEMLERIEEWRLQQ